MDESLFQDFVNTDFAGVVLDVVETLNDTEANPGQYLYRQLLRRDFSVTGKWETLSGNITNISADVISMNSPLPLKKRDAVAQASGDIPKSGIMLTLDEKQLTEIRLLQRTGAPKARIAAKIFNDTQRVIVGQYELAELMFLEGLSTGVTVVEDSENVGLGIRLDSRFPDSNVFGVNTAWSTGASSTPDDDVNAVLNAAVGKTINTVLLDRVALANFAKSTQIKELFAFDRLGVIGTSIPNLSNAQATAFFGARYGINNVILVDRVIKRQKDGINYDVKPWAEGAVVFLSAPTIGSLVYAELAEQAFQANIANYQLADDFILVSKFRETNPLKEFTGSQARFVPVISDTSDIFLLQSETEEA